MNDAWYFELRYMHIFESKTHERIEEGNNKSQIDQMCEINKDFVFNISSE